jgi:DNA replication and repair protein RecF
MDLMTYNKLLDHRNKHLKQDMIDDALIQTLDTQIAPLAQAIYAKRETFLSEFSAVFANEYHRISGERERIILHYTSQLQSNSYLDVAAHCRSKDMILQRSNGGIHKDELELELGGLNLRKYGSQGQIKSSLIALKLAEYKYLQKHTSKNPFLLLDDIFEKIDEERAQVLTQIIKNDNFGQIFITDTNEHRLTAFCEAIGKPYTTLLLA